MGGASFTGGKGTIWGTLIGALLMAVIRNGLNLAGAKNDVQYIVIGSVIILVLPQAWFSFFPRLKRKNS